MTKNYLIIGIAGLITVGFLLIWDSPPEAFLNNSERSPEQMLVADSYMREVTTRVYASDGYKRFSIEAPQIELFENLSEIFIINPRIISYENGLSTLEVSAETGVLAQMKNQIDLNGKIRVKAKTKKDLAFLKTEKLTYFTDSGLITGNTHFDFRNSRAKIQGKGLEAYPEKGIYNFLNQVQGVYESL